MYERIDDSGRTVLLRKPKQCEWCGEIIGIGERAVVRVYRFEGEFNSAKMHPECFDALKKSELDFDGSFEGCEQKRGQVR